jgi:DNA modification methylase
MTVTVTTKTLKKEKHGIIHDLLPLKVSLESVQEDPSNARHHTNESSAQIAESLRQFGQRKPIVVNTTTECILAGNGTLRAARQLGWTHIAAVRVEDDYATATGYAIADNRTAELSEWNPAAIQALFKDIDNPLDIPGVDDEWLKSLVFPDDELTNIKDADTIPEPPENPVSQVGDLWVLGDHRLLCGDSTNPDDIKRLMNDEKADLFATDPPYLVGYDDLEWDNANQGPEFFEAFIKAAIDYAITSNAAWYCFHASKRQAMLEAVWEKLGAFVHQQIIWAKANGVLTYSRYLWKHEPCFFGWIKGNQPPKLKGAEFLSTVWEIPGLVGEDRPDHPTPKPLDCFAIPMRQHVPQGGLCYEPFSGSGSQIMAGEMTGRRVNAMELSPIYVDVAIQRFQQATGKIAYLDGSDGKTFDDIAAERGIDLAA